MSTHHRFRRVVSGLSTGGYAVDNSMMLNDGDSEYLRKINTGAASSNPSNADIGTISVWFKRGDFPSGNNLRIWNHGDGSSPQIELLILGSSNKLLVNGGATGISVTTTQVFRDPHAWTNAVVRIDTSQSTAADRCRLYINGELVSAIDSTPTYPSQYADIFTNSADWRIGSWSGGTGHDWDGYVSEVVYCDSQSLAPTAFGEYSDSGIWRPIDVTDSLSTNKTLSLVDRTAGTAIGDMTDSTAGNNLAAAFDGVFGGNDGANNATKRGSVSNAFVGKNWGTGVSKTITGFSTRDVNNAGYFDNTGEGRFLLYGSNSNPSSYNDGTLLYTGATFTSAGHTTTQPLDFLDTANFDTSTAYQYHWIALVPTSTASDVRMAELIFYEDDGNFGAQGFYLPFTTSSSLGYDYSGVTTSSLVSQNTESGPNEINKGDMDASGLTLAIKFKALSSTAVPQVKIHATSTGFSSATIRIETGSSTAPSGTLVDSNGELTGFTSSGSGLKTITFPNGGPVLTAGTEYWLVLAGTGNWGVSHDYSTTNQVIGSLGIRKAAGYDATQSFGHEIYQVGNNFEVKNSPTQSSDSPTSNFATLTTIDTSPAVFSNGNLSVTSSTSNSYRGGTGSIGLPPGSGKWYVEAKTNGGSLGGNKEYGFGAVTNATDKGQSGYFPGSYGVGEFGYYSGSGGIIYNNPNSSVGSVGVYGSGTVDTVALRFDMDTSSPTCKFYVNNTLKHTSNLHTGLTYFPHFSIQDSSLAWTVNFGATDFTYTIPTDHKAISASNMYEAFAPAIEDGSAHFQATTYGGNSGSPSAKIVTQSGNSKFEPGLVWLKEREGNHGTLIDAVRGGNKGLYPSLNFAEYDESNLSFRADGFSLSTTGAAAQVNSSSNTYVAWQWKAGDSNTSVSESGTGDDAIAACTHRANQTAGFSIVTYQGKNDEIGNGDHTKVAHGLNKKPTLIIGKNLATSKDWFVLSTPQQNDAHMHLNLETQNVGSDFTGTWTDSDTTHFVVGNDDLVNEAGANFVAYVFAEIPGYSKFGLFEGNGSSTDGPFIHLGFRPRFFMWKNLDSATNGSWTMMDSARDPFNMVEDNLRANSTMASDTGEADLDFLSNGVKHRGGAVARFNASSTYLYMAFGDAFAGSTPMTAR